MPTEDKNFVEKLIDAGFKRHIPSWEIKRGRFDSNYNTKNGWMGLVVYHPYEKFIKGSKTVELSLERFGVTDTIISEMGVTKVQVNEKIIKCSIGGQTLYETNFGVIPPIEIQ